MKERRCHPPSSERAAGAVLNLSVHVNGIFVNAREVLIVSSQKIGARQIILLKVRRA